MLCLLFHTELCFRMCTQARCNDQKIPRIDFPLMQLFDRLKVTVAMLPNGLPPRVHTRGQPTLRLAKNHFWLAAGSARPRIQYKILYLWHINSKKPKMVPPKRRRSSLAELREHENQRLAEIFEKNMVGFPIQYDSHYVPTPCLLSTAKTGLKTVGI